MMKISPTEIPESVTEEPKEGNENKTGDEKCIAYENTTFIGEQNAC